MTAAGPSMTPVTRRALAATLASSFVSVLGDQLARLAMSVLVLERTGSAALAAVTYAVTMLPAVLGGPLLGGLADRWPRRRLMVVSDLARAALIVVSTVPGCPLGIGITVIGVVAFLEAGFDGARAALVADLAGTRYLQVLGWDRVVNQTAQLAGFASGGTILLLLGSRASLVVDASTFLVSAALLVGFVAATPPPVSVEPRGGGLRAALADARAGARHVLADGARRRPLLMACTLSAAAVLPEALAAAYARELGHPGAATALIMLANPIGTVTGALWLARRPRPASERRALAWAALATVPLITLAFAPPLGVVIALVALSGVGMSSTLVARALFTAAVEPQLRGRAFAFAGATLTVSQGAAVMLGGVVAEATGAVHLTVAIAAGLALAATTALVLRPSGRRVLDDAASHGGRDRLQLRVRLQLRQD